ncbi:unnamed protein product [Cochlearia groenlandica]
MNHSKKPKTSSKSDSADEPFLASSSSSSNFRPEMMAKKEQVSSMKTQKAENEKSRRDKLHEQFLKLGEALDPNRPKSDKASLITDTIQMLKDLMSQVDRLKSEYVTLSQESLELIQEKRELREEKSSLKTDIEILNAQYHHRVRTCMVPWIPHYTYPIPVVSIQDSNIKSLDLNLTRRNNEDDVGLELELQIRATSSGQQDDCVEEEKGGSLTTPASSSNRQSSSQAVQDSSFGNVNGVLKS